MLTYYNINFAPHSKIKTTRCLYMYDITSLSTKGLAVVDDAIVSQHRLHQCKNMRVIRAQ